MNEARYRELLEAPPPQRAARDALRRFVPRRLVMGVAVRFALTHWRRWGAV